MFWTYIEQKKKVNAVLSSKQHLKFKEIISYKLLKKVKKKLLQTK